LLHCGSFAADDPGAGGDGGDGASSADAAADGASSADAAADGPILDAAPRFCMTLDATPVFCTDFDEPTFPPKGTIKATADGAVTRVGGGFSPPFALSSSTAVSLGRARIDTPPGGSFKMADAGPKTNVHLHAQFRVDAPGLDDGELSLFELGAPNDPNPPGFFLVVNNQGTPHMQVWLGLAGTGTSGPVCAGDFYYTPGAWTSLDMAYAPLTHQISVSFGDGPQFTCSGPSKEILGPDAGPLELNVRLGLDYVRNGSAPILVDDFAIWLE
jgi:hypothetical protein